jgi:hypothetical protein
MACSMRSQSEPFILAGAHVLRHVRLEVRPDGQPEPS